MPQLIGSLKNIIFSKDFCSRYKQNPDDFVRTRILPFHELILFLLNMNNKSYQEELDRYFQTLHNKQDAERVVFDYNAVSMTASKKAAVVFSQKAHICFN